MILAWKRLFRAPAPRPVINVDRRALDEEDDRRWADEILERERRIEAAEQQLSRFPGFADVLADRRRDGTGV